MRKLLEIFKSRSIPVPDLNLPVPPETLDTLRRGDPFWIVLLNYSPLALHKNAIGNQNSWEARAETGELATCCIRYVEYCLGSKLFRKVFKADFEWVAIPYRGELADVFGDDAAEIVAEIEALLKSSIWTVKLFIGGLFDDPHVVSLFLLVAYTDILLDEPTTSRLAGQGTGHTIASSSRFARMSPSSKIFSNVALAVV
jgi:hypothetical protein